MQQGGCSKMILYRFQDILFSMSSSFRQRNINIVRKKLKSFSFMRGEPSLSSSNSLCEGNILFFSIQHFKMSTIDCPVKDILQKKPIMLPNYCQGFDPFYFNNASSYLETSPQEISSKSLNENRLLTATALTLVLAH